MARTGFGTNIDALRAQSSLAKANSQFASSAERLSSGLRINSAADDAAGLAVASSLQAQSRVMTKGIQNINDGISLLSVSENALQTLASITQRQQELAAQAANSSYSTAQRSALNSEAAALSSEFNRIISTTNFNGIKTVDGTLSGFRIQAGSGVDGGVGLVVNSQLSHGSYDGTTFADSVTVSEAAASSLVAVGDVNGDGADDFAVGNGGSFIVTSGADGSQLSTVSPTNGGGSVFLADMNGDSKLDFVSAAGSGMVYIGMGNGDGTFRAFTNTGESNTGATTYLALGDINGDGKQDLVRTYLSTSNMNVDLRYGNGDGTFTAAYVTITGASYGPTYGVGTGDINNDGKDDIFALSSTSSFLSVVLGNVSGNLTFSANISVSAGTFLGASDLNGDGYKDVLLSVSSGQVQFLLNNGSGSLTSTPSNVSVTGTAQGFGDFNGDGKVDILSTNGTNAFIRLGNGDGTFKATGASFAVNAGAVATAKVGDFNGDSSLDILAVSTANQTARANYQTTGTTLTTNEIAIDLTTASHARYALTRLSNQLNWIDNELGTVGSAQSRLSAAFATLAQSREQYSAAASRITDIDTAQEVAQYTRSQVLQQSAAAALAHANLDPKYLLKLLG